MKKLSTLLGLLLICTSALAAELPELPTKIATKANLQEIRSGGYVLYLRHGLTDTSHPDRAPQVDLNDCSTQRPLTEDGRKLMVRIGDYIRKAGIPISEVRASPMCRARQSAQAAFGDKFVVDNLLMYSGNMTDQEKAPVVAHTLALLTQPVAAGTNRLILAHSPNLMDTVGYYPRPEGTMVILKPLPGGKVEYIATIMPQHWPDLLQ